MCGKCLWLVTQKQEYNFIQLWKKVYFYNVSGIGLIKIDKSYEKDVILRNTNYYWVINILLQVMHSWLL